MVGGSAGDGRIGGDGFCCAKSMVGGPACEWVSKDGSAVGGLVAAMGGCVGCGGSVGGGGCCCCWFFFFLRWCWWMWVCASICCRRCCSQGGCAVVVVVVDDDDDDGEVV